MLPDRFRALRMTEQGPQFAVLTPDDLPSGEVTVRVRHSSLNYKDGLALSGQPGILTRLPMTPGIDLAGEVLQDTSGTFAPGDAVLLTGWGTGERRDGGYAELARVSAAHLLPLPPGRDTRWAMAVGTAGLTAMLALRLLARHGLPGREVLVTGAAGGVGSFAVALLARAGYTVTASTGRPGEAERLRALGAAEVMGRLESPARPLEKGRWDGAVDTVGGETLAAVLAGLRAHGAAAACGNAGGARLSTSVYPFILRGVALLGTDSNTAPHAERIACWAALAEAVDDALLGILGVQEIALEELPAAAERILAGRVSGRTVVRVG